MNRLYDYIFTSSGYIKTGGKEYEYETDMNPATPDTDALYVEIDGERFILDNPDAH